MQNPFQTQNTTNDDNHIPQPSRTMPWELGNASNEDVAAARRREQEEKNRLPRQSQE